jgi:hypothetical protein
MSVSIITEHFVKDHEVLNQLTEKFFESDRNGPDFTNRYNDLRNALRRHMDQERTLYNLYKGQEQELLDKIDLILKQHKLILDILEQIYYGESSDNSQLTRLLEEHKTLEEEYVYVKFDEVLSHEEKMEVIKDLGLYEKESEETA